MQDHLDAKSWQEHYEKGKLWPCLYSWTYVWKIINKKLAEERKQYMIRIMWHNPFGEILHGKTALLLKNQLV